MGLSISVTLANGFVATYWVPQRAVVNPLTHIITISILGYKDQAAADGGLPAADIRELNIPYDPTQAPFTSLAAYMATVITNCLSN